MTEAPPGTPAPSPPAGIGTPLLEAIPKLLDDYVHLWSVSARIVRHPIRFGESIKETSGELGRSVSYVVQSLALYALMTKFLVKIDVWDKYTKNETLKEFAPTIVAVITLMLSVTGYFSAKLIYKNRSKPYSMMSAYLYFYGILFVLLSLSVLYVPIYKTVESNEILLSIVELILTPFLLYALVIYGSLFFWIGRMNGGGFWRGMTIFWLGFLIPLLIFVLALGALAAIVSMVLAHHG